MSGAGVFNKGQNTVFGERRPYRHGKKGPAVSAWAALAPPQSGMLGRDGGWGGWKRGGEAVVFQDNGMRPRSSAARP